MTALEVEQQVELLPTWFHPGPEGGWTVEDLENLHPWAPRRIELLDGALIVLSPQRSFHSVVMRRLANALEPQIPDGHHVDTEMVVRLSKRNGPEPDVLVAAVPVSPSRTYYDVADIRLVVEIVSEESVLRDRDVKPRRCADAGIPYFWRTPLAQPLSRRGPCCGGSA